MEVNRYNFNKIVSKTKKLVEPIKHGKENGIYFEYLALIEIKMYHLWKAYAINGRQAKEIIQLVLVDIQSYTEGKTFDCSKLMEHNYLECVHEIEELFIPNINLKLQASLKENILLDDDYFELSRKVLIRVHESIDQWTNTHGAFGYFNFIGSFVGGEIEATLNFLVDESFLLPYVF